MVINVNIFFTFYEQSTNHVSENFESSQGSGASSGTDSGYHTASVSGVGINHMSAPASNENIGESTDDDSNDNSGGGESIHRINNSAGSVVSSNNNIASDARASTSSAVVTPSLSSRENAIHDTSPLNTSNVDHCLRKVMKKTPIGTTRINFDSVLKPKNNFEKKKRSYFLRSTVINGSTRVLRKRKLEYSIPFKI